MLAMVEKTFHIIRKTWILNGSKVNFLTTACLAVKDLSQAKWKSPPWSPSPAPGMRLGSRITANKRNGFGLLWLNGFSKAAAKTVLLGASSANWVSRSIGPFICQPGCPYLCLGSDLGQKKTQAKEIHLELPHVDSGAVEELFIIYRLHNCVLYSNLIWASE